MTGIKEFTLRVLRYLFLPSAGRCPYCRKEMGNGCICEQCKKELDVRRLCFSDSADTVSVYRYDGVVRRAVMQLKFGNRRYLAEVMAKDMAFFVSQKADIITFVPMHTKRQRARGYNQSELIAEKLGSIVNVPVKGLLVKNKNTPQQSRIKNRDQRKKNVLGTFSAIKDADIKGKNIVIIDDVITSGITVAECAKELGKLHPAKINVLSFAAAE